MTNLSFYYFNIDFILLGLICDGMHYYSRFTFVYLINNLLINYIFSLLIFNTNTSKTKIKSKLYYLNIKLPIVERYKHFLMNSNRYKNMYLLCNKNYCSEYIMEK